MIRHRPLFRWRGLADEAMDEIGDFLELDEFAFKSGALLCVKSFLSQKKTVWIMAVEVVEKLKRGNVGRRQFEA